MSPITLHQFSLRTAVYYVCLALCVTALLAYAGFQARLLIAGPQIILTNESHVSYAERLVSVEGYANNITHITLNGRQIYTDKNGYFKEAIVLENGYTVAMLRAQDRYGRETTRSQSYVYAPEELPIN